MHLRVPTELASATRLCLFVFSVLLGLLLTTTASAEDEPVLFPGVFITELSTGLAHSGTFSTWGYEVFGPPNQTVVLRARMSTPPGWTILSRQPTIELQDGEVTVLPFTVWIPEGTSADHTFDATLELVGEHGGVVASATREIEVAPLYDVRLREIGELSLIAGKQTVANVEVRNDGNRTATVFIEATSRPEWIEQPGPAKIDLSPGASQLIEFPISVPETSRAGGVFTALVTATLDADGVTLPADQLPLTGSVRALQSAQSSYRHLPVRVQGSWENHRSHGNTVGLRISSKGQASADTFVDIEMDLESEGGRKDSWNSQFFRAGIRRDWWELAFGDVTERFPDVSTGSLSGRGTVLRARDGLWTLRAYSGKGLGQSASSAAGAGLGRQIGKYGRAMVDVVRQRRAATSTVPAEQTDLSSFSSEFRAGDRFLFRTEGAVSRSNLPQFKDDGHGLHSSIRYLDSRLSVRARAFTGTEQFRGRNKDRDGYLAHASVTLHPTTSIWSSIDRSDGGSGQPDDIYTSTARSERVGLRFYPRKDTTYDISLGLTHDQQSEEEVTLDVSKRDLVATVWENFGRLNVSISGRFGDTMNRIEQTEGEIRGFGVTASGTVKNARAVVGWNTEREEVPNTTEDRDATTLSGDLSWHSLHGGLRVGVGVNSRTFATLPGSSQLGWETAYRPHIETRLTEQLRLRIDADLRQAEEPLRLHQTQVSLTWSADSAVPLVWSPIRGGIRVLSFIDENMNGEFDPEEETVSGVLFTIEGEAQITDDRGQAHWPPMSAGNYWIDIGRSSLPRGIISAESFPRFLSVSSGEDVDVLVPLSRTCEVSGVIFHDQNHDSKKTIDEDGVEDVQITLLRNGLVIAQGVTDLDGLYRFDRLRPGDYELRVEEDRLPRNWIATGAARTATNIGTASRRSVKSFGVARKRRQIITTYHGSIESSEREQITDPE